MAIKQRDLLPGVPDYVETDSGLLVELIDGSMLRFATRDPSGAEVISANIRATPEEWREIALWIIKCVAQWEGEGQNP